MGDVEKEGRTWGGERGNGDMEKLQMGQGRHEERKEMKRKERGESHVSDGGQLACMQRQRVTMHGSMRCERDTTVGRSMQR